MYELALSNWHVTPEYINEQWTEEILSLMFASRKKRIKAKSHTEEELGEPVDVQLSSDAFLNKWAESFRVEKVN